MLTELSRYNLGVTFFETLIARSYLINFLITGGFLWLARTVCYSKLNLTSDRLCECQGRQKQGDDVIFRPFFVFTRSITHVHFVNCRASRACALKNRKPQKWHPVFDYPRVLGISIRLTVNARGLWARDWA